MMKRMQQASDDRIATVAACTPIGLPRNQKNRSDVLTPGEWNRLARWLVETGQRPGALLFSGIVSDLESSHLEPTLKRKARSIAERASTTLTAIEALEELGIWVRCRADSDYPIKWKQRLKSVAPPAFFGIGDIGMFDSVSVAIIGSRDVTPMLAKTAETFGTRVASASSVVISGAARGTDRYGMLGALEANGRSVGILAGSLQRISRDAELRSHIANEQLCLISQVHPAAGFTVGNAMARNRLIYALADLAIVVSTSDGSGGTWNGALENLHRRWAPIAVWCGSGAPVANGRLVEQGAYPLFAMPRENSPLSGVIEAAAHHARDRDDRSETVLRLINESAPPAY